MGLEELHAQYPHIGEKLGPGNTWTSEAEKSLIETFWTPEQG
jgi:hypothetical protein